MNSEGNVERKVGIFVFVGILVTCALILHFGKVGTRFHKGYPITVRFNNAGQLVPGAQVLFAGVLVGKVDEIELNTDGTGVEVSIRMFLKGIRKDAHFMIKQTGLLGDQHIEVVPVSTTAPLLAAGDQIKGVDPFDFSDVEGKAGEVVQKLTLVINKLTTEVLEKDTLDNLKRSIKNFADLTSKLQGTSERLNDILSNAQKGQGTIGKFLTNDAVFEELRQLIHNWRVYGILHQDKSEQHYPSPKQIPAKEP